MDSAKAHIDSLIHNPKLTDLEPLFIPDPVLFEFITPGWFILLGLLLLVLLFSVYRIIAKYKLNQYKRTSAKDLYMLKNEIEESSPAEISQKVSTILKKTAEISYGRANVARLSGEEWGKFLSDQVTGIDVSSFSSLAYQYVSEGEQQSVSTSEIENLIDVSISWVRRHRV
jgi:hypothetical protein